jgi:hypothetical protein
MKIIGITLCICLLAGMLLATDSYAWDKKRKGFLFGLGGGYGTVPEFYEYELGYGAICTNLNIGYAPKDQVLIYFESKALWFIGRWGKGSDESFIQFWATSWAVWTPSIAVNYYFKPEARSLYVKGGGGLTVAGSIVGASEFGRALFGGVGYEWSPRWSVSLESNFNWWNDFDNSFIDIRLLFNWMGY